MPRATENKERTGKRVDICFNKSYRNLGYLAGAPQCSDCPNEKQDLFTGTAGVQLWQWYCKLPSP